MVRRRRLLWLTRGPRAGRLEDTDAAEAAAIVDAGMGQSVAGLTGRQLRAAQITDDPYPASVAAMSEQAGGRPEAEAETATKPGPARKATYRRRDLRAED